MLSYSKEPQVLQRISKPVWPGVLVQGPQDVQELPQDGPAVAAARPEVRLRASELIESDAGVAVVLPDCARDCQVSCGKRVNFFLLKILAHKILYYITTVYYNYIRSLRGPVFKLDARLLHDLFHGLVYLQGAIRDGAVDHERHRRVWPPRIRLGIVVFFCV